MITGKIRVIDAQSHELTPPQVSGTPQALVYEHTGMDHITDAMNDGGIKPMYIHGYSPIVLSSDGTMISKPSSLKRFRA